MFAAGTDGLQVVGSPNSQIVDHVDPENPVIQEQQNLGDGQAFMRLMIEQLKHQDPLNPMQSNEFTQQLAALNSLEQLVNMNQLLESSAAGAKLGEATILIDRYVEGLDAANTLVQGYVERVEVIEGEPMLKIGDQLLLLNQVVTVYSAWPDAEQEAPSGGEEQ